MARAPRTPRGTPKNEMTRSSLPVDPAVEYERLTGRPAESDWLAGVVIAAPSYANQWLRTSALGLLRELDVALDKNPAKSTELSVQPIAAWARPALVWWAALRELGLVWPDVEKLGRIPSAKNLQEILSDPPLPQICALFGLARAMSVAGYVVGHGLGMATLPDFIRDAAVRAFKENGASVGDPNEINLGSVVMMVEAARFTVEEVRKRASWRISKVRTANGSSAPCLHSRRPIRARAGSGFW